MIFNYWQRIGHLNDCEPPGPAGTEGRTEDQAGRFGPRRAEGWPRDVGTWARCPGAGLGARCGDTCRDAVRGVVRRRAGPLRPLLASGSCSHPAPQARLAAGPLLLSSRGQPRGTPISEALLQDAEVCWERPEGGPLCIVSSAALSFQDLWAQGSFGKDMEPVRRTAGRDRDAGGGRRRRPNRRGPGGSGAATGPDTARSWVLGAIPWRNLFRSLQPSALLLLRADGGAGAGVLVTVPLSWTDGSCRLVHRVGVGPGTTADWEQAGVTAVAVTGAHARL